MGKRKTSPSTIAPNGDATQKVFINVPVPARMFSHHGKPLQKFPSNAISTSKYTAWNFLPKNLFEQFRRVANLYFLLLTILQFFPAYSTINPFVSALPLIVIVGLTAVKDGVEDWRRHQSDREMNGTMTWKCGGWTNVNQVFCEKEWALPWVSMKEKRSKGDRRIAPIQEDDTKAADPPKWVPTPWSDVKTGDIILLHSNDSIPADLLILSTSEPSSLCYIETKNLDGETNLKIRKGVTETEWMTEAGVAEDVGSISGWVEYERPNGDLYSFLGTMILNKVGETGKNVSIRIPLTITTLLLRGCILRNTEWVIGLVINTGNNTKIRMNAGKTPSKRSKTEKRMNVQVFINLLLLFAICFATCIANPIWERRRTAGSPMWLDWTYKSGGMNVGAAGLDAFWMSLIIYQNVVPLSLYITLEIVKTIQAYFIYEDIEMYHAPNDQRCIPRSWAIADDLGQIDYVFSDKTGTLTRNVMEFKKFSVAGIVYGNGGDDLETSQTVVNAKEIKPERPSFWDLELEKRLSDPAHPDYHSLATLFTSLAVCHTVLISKDPKTGKITYNAQSPDESALVDGAKSAGFIFSSRENTTISVDVRGVRNTYELLNVLEFNSNRKRMSVVVRESVDGGESRVVLYCKGADSVIWERLRSGQEQVKEVTGQHLENFAEEGLRTLCIAQRVLPEEMYKSWSKTYHDASTSLTDREARMDAAAELIECDLELLGATAIEDKLQEGVPECIAMLLDAGVKVWVLTGDKMETAINIGFSCNLLMRDMALIVVRADIADGPAGGAGVLTQMKRALETFFGETQAERNIVPVSTGKDPQAALEDGMLTSTNPPTSPSENPIQTTHALIIDGQALQTALQPQNRSTLLKLSTHCTSVICCRVSPLQKAQIVTLIKETGAMCLSIGDGANDVSMIQAAHIGVGIAGQEGLQAAMASDYAIAQFRFLERLMLVHGRWSFGRICEMILCFFVKNVVWVMVLFWYQFYAGFSAQSVYDFTYTLLYNIVFTGLPVIMIGVFDQDLSPRSILSHPAVYHSGTKWGFSMGRFAAYMLDSVYQSLVIFYFAWAVVREGGSMWGNGQVPGLDFLGCTTAICGVVNANLVVILSTNSFTWMNAIFYTLSEIIVVLWTVLYSFFPGSTLWGVVNELFTTPVFWLVVLLTTICCQLPKLALRFGKRMIRPSNAEVVQEIQKVENQVGPSWKVRQEEPCEQGETTLPPAQESMQQQSTSAEPGSPTRPSQTQSSLARPSILISEHTPSSYHANIGTSPKDSPTLSVMQTGKTLRNRGYSFSQSPGALELLAAHSGVELDATAASLGRVFKSEARLIHKEGNGAALIVRTKTAPGRLKAGKEGEKRRGELPWNGTKMEGDELNGIDNQV
ncbi:phospholipid-translocating P-type ATPase, flippase [Spizellomyces punctatus DAOM BR117]|uniref:Phospholipid-transporting ATPase n=1 Tax=Spizellomyces punctatus (strain DAOM BR117) TaxID=645134 RepID=A0A0L0H983_SPIPD|nr:phospholipid-translocating P-type ATPase, flippase [Spizellomyces punctatus DAOM BR117]KNC98070.1 phospholipid-translocating P-type ATPase, flippase [Spizellomyces punctatus DAOM BR117]|eukprot:XP_016606110.1 phospholipid-translocating P-type ATPase, flippase [Spizellomyces punctatus DAOM BR117]